MAPTGDIIDFSLRLWKKVSNDNKENVWISPVSVSLCMTPLYDGAEGDTKQELGTIVCDYQPEQTQQLKIANALFFSPSIKLNKAYKNLCINKGTMFYTEPITANLVNQWANDNTNGKINNVLQEPVGNLQMVVANAIYFKGEWDDSFYERATNNNTFYLDNEHTTTVKMMQQTNFINYWQSDDVQVGTLLYKIDEQNDSISRRYAMTIVLPREGKDINELLSSITKEEVLTWMTQSSHHRVHLSIPRLSLNYNRDLTNDLKALGVNSALDPNRADFSYITNRPLFVNMVKQCSYLRMDEHGTEAAAVTIAALKATSSLHSEEPIEMKVNRPYMLILQDYENHTPLFVGTIYNPNN